MASLEDLPAELILLTFDFLDPEAHLDFALTNPFIAHVAKDVLAHHRKCHDEFHQSSITAVQYSDDENVFSLGDTSIGDFLTQLTDDPIAAWHVRELTIVDGLDKEWLSSPVDPASVGHDLLDDVVGPKPNIDINTTSDEYLLASHKTRARLEWGSTKAKHALLVTALCPRLHTLYLMDDNADVVNDSSMERSLFVDFFADAVFYIWLNASILSVSNWPRGFRNIRSVILHGEPRDWYRGEQHYRVDSTTALPFFLLPAAETVRLVNMNMSVPAPREGVEEYIRKGWFKGRSSIRTLIFSGEAEDASNGGLEPLVETTAALHNIVFRDINMYAFDTAVEDVCRLQGASLETLVFLGCSPRLRGNNIPKYVWSSLDHLKAVRVLTVDVLDMIPSSNRLSWIEVTYGDETAAEFLDRFVGSIPPTVEVLILQESATQRLNDKEIHRVGTALMRLIDSKRCPKLTSIYADNFEAKMKAARCFWGTRTDGNWLQAAKTYAKKRGVSMFTQDEKWETDRFLRTLCQDLGDQRPVLVDYNLEIPGWSLYVT